MMKSFVKYFNEEKGYGYISGKNVGVENDIKIHSSNIKSGETIKVGDTVKFEIYENEYGMNAKNIVLVERNEVRHNTEDKSYWYKDGEEKEREFIDEITPLIDRKLIIHPEKKYNKSYIDLLNTETGELADLKSQREPFFTINSRDNRYDPRFTVTFNRKDYESYLEKYPKAVIYFWVRWESLKFRDISVEPLEGVWEIPFSEIKNLVESDQLYLHPYKNRKDDVLNARDSYALDLRVFNSYLLWKRDN
ncbi:cold-shock protein [Priestia megaterium]|uniref:cold-shock protein n=1 Tax=Priestia megaterium TaxID=1404 RepID=UPI00221E76B4|nr:cold shock domain-containing protein [Priestia megaterium]UYV50703.1 cold shock domain-containing protein [Priestia megaterium]